MFKTVEVQPAAPVSLTKRTMWKHKWLHSCCLMPWDTVKTATTARCQRYPNQNWIFKEWTFIQR